MPFIVPIIAYAVGFAAWGLAAFLPALAFVSEVAFGIGFLSATNVAAHALQRKPNLGDLAAQARSFSVMVRQAAAPWRVLYGRTRMAPIPTFLHLTGTKNEYLHAVMTFTGHKLYEIGNMYFDGVLVPVDGSGDATGKFAGYVHLKKHTGDPTDTSQPFPELASAAPTKWTANHLQRGRAKVYLRLKWNADLFPSGTPNVTFDLKGKEVWDPRTSTTAYSENSALCLRDYLVDTAYGMAAASTEIDDGVGSTIRAAANICDEDVNLRTGTEKRYTTNGAFDLSRRPADLVRDLLSPMAGYLTYINGKFGLFAGAWRAAALTLTDGDLRGAIKYDARISRADIFNAVKGIYVCPTNNWQPADFPAWTNATYEAEDGERIWRDLELPFTISSATAQRLAKIELERARRQGSLILAAKLVGYKAQAADVIGVTHDRFSWTAKTFEVISAKLTGELDANESPVLGVDLACRQTDSGVYAWSSSEEKTIGAPPTTTLPDGNVVAAPTGLTLTDYSVLRADGIRVTHLKVAWTAPADEFVTSGGKIHIEFKKVADSTYIGAGTVAGSAVESSIAKVDDAVNYDVRIRAENSYGALSAWVADQHVVSGDTAILATGVTQRDAGGTPRHPFRYDDPDHTLDQVIDGSTYGRVLGTRITLGVPYVYRGEWVASTSYLKGDEVAYPSAAAGNIYACMTANNDATWTVAHWLLIGPASVDQVVDGSTYARTTPNQRDGGGRGYATLTSTNKVYPGAFADSNPGVVTSQVQIADGTTDDETGYWVSVATVDFQVPAGCANIQFTLTASLGGGTSGPVVLYTSGDNIGIAIYTGTIPNDPTVSRYGTGTVVYPTPSGTKLTVYMKGKPGTREYIEGKCSQDVVTPLRSGYVL